MSPRRGGTAGGPTKGRGSVTLEGRGATHPAPALGPAVRSEGPGNKACLCLGDRCVFAALPQAVWF